MMTWQNSPLFRGITSNPMFQQKNGLGNFPHSQGAFPFPLKSPVDHGSVFRQYQHLLALMSAAAASNLDPRQYSFHGNAQCRPLRAEKPDSAHSADSPAVSPSVLTPESGVSPDKKQEGHGFRPCAQERVKLIEPKRQAEEIMTSSQDCPQEVSVKLEAGYSSHQLEDPNKSVG